MVRRLNIYFIHASWLKDREKVINDFQRLLGKYGFKDIKGTKVRIITDYDPDKINGDVINKTVNYTPIKDEDENITNNDGNKLSFYNGLLKNLHLFQLSNSLKHYKALEEIMNGSGDDDINIVLEDDVLYEDKVCMLLERVINDLPSNYDMVFLGLPSNIDAKKRSETKFQITRDVFRVLPYCDSYIVSKEAAKKLYDNYLPIKFVNNVQLSYLIEKMNLRPLIALPNLFMDGSKFGMFLSILTPNNQLLFNNDYMRCKMLLDAPSLSGDDKNTLDKLIKESQLHVHPDFMHLQGVYYAKEKKYEKSKELYEKALKMYQGNNCIVNHESTFLKDYIRLYKNLQ